MYERQELTRCKERVKGSHSVQWRCHMARISSHFYSRPPGWLNRIDYLFAFNTWSNVDTFTFALSDNRHQLHAQTAGLPFSSHILKRGCSTTDEAFHASTAYGTVWWFAAVLLYLETYCLCIVVNHRLSPRLFTFLH